MSNLAIYAAAFRILALIQKELLAILKDPRSRTVIFMPPVAQCLIFGYAVTFDLNRIPYAAFDHDRSIASQTLLHELDGSGIFQRVSNLDRPQEIKAVIDRQRALLMVQIDQDFERKLFSGEPAEIQVIGDGRNSNTAATALSYINTVVEEFNSRWRVAHGLGGPPVRVSSRVWFNANMESQWSIIPTLIAMLAFTDIILLTAMSIAREREQGTLDQLLVTPFRPAEIMIGKSVPSIVVGLIQVTVVILVAQLWFHVPFSGSYFTLYIGIFLFLFASVGLGLLISSLVSTMQQALLGTFLTIMPFTILSGFLAPISTMPKILQYLTISNPTRYGVDFCQRVYLEGLGLGDVPEDTVPLVIIGVVTFAAAGWVFRRRTG